MSFKEVKMNIFKRAWISVTRRKANSLVLLLIVFILANVLLTTFSLTTSLKKTRETVLSQMNPKVTLEMDYEKIMEEDMEKLPPFVTSEQAKEIYEKGKSFIKDYEVSKNSWMSLTPSLKEAELLEALSGGGNEFITGESYISLKGADKTKIGDIASGEAKLISGKGFRDEDLKNGNNKVLISKQFAEANNLEVGSTFSLTKKLYDANGNGMNGTEKALGSFDEEFEVVGILEYDEVNAYITKNKDKKNPNLNDAFLIQEKANAIIIPNEAISKIENRELAMSEQLGIAQEGAELGYLTLNYTLRSYKDTEAFTKVVEEVTGNPYVKVNSATSAYAQSAKPLESMEGMLDMVFVITIFASVVILALVLCIFMYLRQKELGVFLALGQKKSEIVMQLFIEALLVCIVGASFAILTSLIFSNWLADSVMQSMLNPVLDAANEGGMTSIVVGGGSLSIDPDVIAQNYQGGFSLETIFIFYGIMIVTIILAQAATSLYLLRLQPKKILM